MKQIKNLIMWSFLALLLIACSEADPNVDEKAHQFAEDYENGKYEDIYHYLSEEVHNQISKEDFAIWHEEIDENMNATNRTLSLEKVEVAEGEEVPENEQYFLYEIQVETPLGSITNDGRILFELIEPEDGDKEWKVHWSPGLLLPQIDYGESVKIESSQPIRGEIHDRNGEALALNGSVLEVAMVQGRLDEHDSKEEMYELAVELLGVTEEYIDAQMSQSWVREDMIVPIKTLVYTGNEELMETLQEVSHKGLTFREVNGRVYPFGEAAAHLTGFTGPIFAEELEEKSKEGYTAQSQLGKSGLEQIFENELRGELGGKVVITSADGEEKDVLISREPVDGQNLSLTIDMNVQLEAFSQLQNEQGLNVTMNPQSGEVLALVSMPTYDPNEMVVNYSEAYQQYSDMEGHVFLSKFNQKFIPGSTIKPITAAIALENGWDPSKKVDVPESNRWQKDSSWGDHYITRVSGIPLTSLNLNEAMLFSDNIYFAQLALDTGGSAISEGLDAFGFNEVLPFETILAESTFVNDGHLEREALLADTGYGQGELLVNPLHLASMFTAFLHEGNMIQPTILMGESNSTFWKEAVVSPETAAIVKESIHEAIQNEQATGRVANVSGLNLAGKTGTAEHKVSQDEEGEETGWFVVFNDGTPEILSLVMLEHVENRGGSGLAAQKVKNIIESVN
ncbi:penicillin-binding transpeptidase domain-containing protein [Alkalihalobacillus pseudalcaliphilus]|uniref:penicillin-binding transpeptidase domain-containing protein n=1 Tax=Alkalihalobacillus pseudalcaliphilus TaxID=79884 RepID=UPI00064DCFDC|nr:penicillin-binding transpeptidase domain-containing protein [Alkalihalobacillus pseudalcaliphilus]KMK76375.1 hypothetical protein AB990_14365 [Alkalihalobacillus pseudalcaliphilus]